MPAPAGQHDSIITFGLDMVEETEQNAGIIIDHATEDAAASEPQQGPASEQDAALQQAREAAEEARKREAEEEQERQRERDGMER
jgi:hypothetical protein